MGVVLIIWWYVQFVLMSQPNAGDMREFLKHVYDTCYVEHVVKNPLYTPGEPFEYVLKTLYNLMCHSQRVYRTS